MGVLCADKTSEISKNVLSGILVLLCAEQNVGNLKNCTFWNSGTPVRRTRRRKSQKMHFQELWDSCAQNNTSEISKNALSGILGLLCAEQSVGNFKQWTFRDSGTPARRTRRRKSQKMHFQEFWDSHDVGNLTNMHFQEFWDSCAPRRTPKRRSAPLAAVVGLFSLDRVTCP